MFGILRCALSFRCDSPWSWTLCSLWTIRSRMASAKVGVIRCGELSWMQHQVTPTAIISALRRNIWKHTSMLLPITQHFSFHISTTTLAHNCHRNQFAVTALWLWTRSFEKQTRLLLNIIYNHVHPSTKVFKIVINGASFFVVWFVWVTSQVYSEGHFLNQIELA